MGFASSSGGANSPTPAAVAAVQTDVDALQVDTASLIVKVDADKAVDDLGATAAALTTVGTNVSTALTRIGSPATSLTVDVAAVKADTAALLVDTGDGTDAAVAPGVAGSLHGHIRDIQADVDLVYARQGAPAGASQSADVAAVKVDTGNLVTRVGTPTELTSLVGMVGTGDQAASAGAGTPGETLHQKLRWLMANGGGATQASVDAIQTDLGNFSAEGNLQSALAYLGTLLDDANIALGTMSIFGFSVYKISAVTSDTSFTIAAAATSCPSPLSVIDTYANQIIYKVGGSAAVGAAGIISTSSSGAVLTLSGSGLASATVNDRVLILAQPSMVGKSGDSASAASPTLHAKCGTGGSSSVAPGTSTGTVFGNLQYLFDLLGTWKGNSNITSLKAMFNHAGWDNSNIGIGTALAMGALKAYTTTSSGSGVFTLTALSGGAAVPATADCLRGARIHVLTGAQAGRTLWCHSYSTGGVVRHDMTGTSVGSTVYIVVEPSETGARKMATWHPWDLPAVMVTQATDTSVPDQAVTVTQTTGSATYVVLEKKTFTSADAPLALDWIKTNRLIWTSVVTGAGTGSTRWYISPESATETVNSAPSVSAIAISNEVVASASLTTHYLNAISPVLSTALPANGGFHLLLAGKEDAADTLSCTVLASSYLTIG